MIRDETLQYDVNRIAAKMSALSWEKIDKYEYITGEKTLAQDKRRAIEESKFTYSPLSKASVKEKKTIEDQGEKK